MSRELPEGWRLTAFNNIASDVSIRNRGRDQIPVLSVTKYDGFVPSEEYFQKRVFSADTENYKIVRKGQFAYATIHLDEGSIDRLSLFDVGLISPMYTVFVIDERQADPDFILRLFKFYATNGQFDALGNGGVNRRKSISFVTLGKLSIPLPPLHEQRRIAEILSSVDEAIAATLVVIEQTRAVKQGVLERLLTKGISHTRFKQTEIGEIPEGWDVAPIEAYLARLIDYRGVPPPKSDSGVPLITAKNVRFGYLNPEPREYISEDDFDGWMRRGLPEAGDVLFTTEAPLGNVAQIPDYKIALGQRTITLCPDRARLTPTFLKWLLLSPGAQSRIAENATGSTALGIKQSTFRKLKFPFPPLDEQETIAEHIEGIAATEAVETAKLGILNLIKTALMSDLLTGRKRVTDALPMAAE